MDEFLFEKDGKITLDLEKAILLTLEERRRFIREYLFSRTDTFEEKDLLHSYRRDKKDSDLSACITTMLQPGEYFEPEEEE